MTSLLASQLADVAALTGLTALGALPVLAVGAWLTRRSGRSSARRQVLVVALAPLAATWVGAAVAVRAMFIDAHYVGAFAVIASTAAVVGVLAAWRLAQRIQVDATNLEELSRAIADGRLPAEPPGSSVAELARLGDELSAMSQRLAAAHERERALERSRRELVAWVSHDLRGPLASIRATAEAVEDGVVSDPSDVQRYLRSIGAETARLTALVDDLFELSRIAAGAIEIAAEPVRIDALVRGVLDGVRPTARARGIRLRAEVAGVPDVLASPAAATRVLRNLVDNAVRHTPDGGTVEVLVAADGDGALVSVVDECGGIPAEDLGRVFDVAFRGDGARGRDDGGGGLGLAIAKGLTEAQAGSIGVTNVAQGCCFQVRFPPAGAS